MKSTKKLVQPSWQRVPTRPQLIGLTVGIVLLLLTVCSASVGAVNGKARAGFRNYIVVLKNSVEYPGAVAKAQIERREGDLSAVYRSALNGYAATLPTDEIDSLREDPRVAFVTLDHEVTVLEEEVELETEENGGVEVFEATIPTGISRIFAPGNKALDIDGKDDIRANVDVAVIDTGIDFEHPDLNVVARTSCITGTCIDGTGTDVYTHGTHVAGTIGAIDNGIGVVGIAPGARMWAVKSLGDGGSGLESWIIKGVEWVTAHASEIEVANMSLGCFCSMPALDKAINSSVEAGVVYAVAAGNSNANVSSFSPASNANVITVSALADYDGLSGGKSSSTCQNYGLDDRKASFSNYGSGIEITAPGVCTLSTVPGNKYGYKSGTSMASPHVAGAAAILAGISNPSSKKDAEAIRETLIKAGNSGWTDTSGDGTKEPLLDVSNEAVFKLAATPVFTSVFGTNGSGNGQFSYPSDVALDSAGNIWVVDGFNHRVQKFNSKGEYLSQFGTYGTGNGQFNYPSSIAFTSTGDMWITDYENSRVQKFSSNGVYLSKFGTKGVASGQFNGPSDIAIAPSGHIFVVDALNSRVQKFTEGGQYVSQFGSNGTGNGQFTWPNGIAADQSGNIWVSDGEAHRLQKFNAAGEYVSKFGVKGSGAGQFEWPGPISIKPSGTLLVADPGNNRVQEYTASGDFLIQFGSAGSGNGQFNEPAGLTFGSGGAIYVADLRNHRVQKWQQG